METRMNSDDAEIIALSRTKIAFLVLGACALAAIGVWLFSLGDGEVIGTMHRDPAIVHGTGVVSIVVFGLFGLFGLKKLFDKRPGLILNSSGIVDNASAVSAGLIPWSEVVGTEVFTIRRQKLMIIKIRDPQQYIESEGPLKRALHSANYRMCGSPIVISSNTLKMDLPNCCAS
jgi:hypothetical protein